MKSTAKSMVLVLAYAAAVLAPFALSLPGWTLDVAKNPLEAFYSAVALMAFPILALQPVLAARIRLLDRAFGLDSVYFFHKSMGISAAMLFALKPLMLASARGDWSLLAGTADRWSVLAGNVGVLVIAALVFTALLYPRLGLGYETWRKLHNVLAVAALALIFTTDVESLPALGSTPALGAWWSLMLLALCAYAGHKVLGPILRRRRAYAVSEVVRETHNVWTLRLSPPSSAPPLDYLPGQFHFLTFYRGRDLPPEEHPFTISSSPTEEGFHASTIKESGDFTATVGQTQPGDRVAVQGPYGRFSYALHPGETDLVFIAGGIGITPLMSMLRHMRDTAAIASVVLLYANRTEEDIVFRDELDAMASGTAPALKVVHVLSRPAENWTGEKGHIGKEIIMRHVEGEAREKTFYVCGPPSMMSAVSYALLDLGVPDSRIRSERFAL